MLRYMRRSRCFLLQLLRNFQTDRESESHGSGPAVFKTFLGKIGNHLLLQKEDFMAANEHILIVRAYGLLESSSCDCSSSKSSEDYLLSAEMFWKLIS